MDKNDGERIKDDDKVLVVLTNQYMFMQLLWYYSKYPEGICEVIILKFVDVDLMNSMYQKCVKCGFFTRIMTCESSIYGQKLLNKIIVMLRYLFQYITQQREKSDKKFLKGIVGEGRYKKVIIQSTHDSVSTAIINAMSDSILVCLEDGMGDYLPVKGMKECFKLSHFSLFKSNILQLSAFMLAKMNVANVAAYGYQFQLRYDAQLIKYCSLPDKMKYRNYKEIKQLFDNDSREIAVSENELSLKQQEYDVIVFSTAFADFGDCEELYYSTLQDWLKKNYKGRKILFKPHPREQCGLNCNDLNIHIGGREIAGERVLDILPDAEIVLTYTTTILLKICREKRNFKILRFNNIKSKWYHLGIENDSEVLGLSDSDWIILGGRKDE